MSFNYKFFTKPAAFFKKTAPLFLVFFCILVAFLPRFGMFGLWSSGSDYLTMDGVPLITSVDGYYYLSNSKDLLNGTYTPIDHKRAFPTGVARSTPAPLLSVIIAGVSRISGISIDWIAPFIPIFLSLFLAIPLYLIGTLCGSPLTGYTAAIIGLTAQGYITRTSLGVLDTDCLNATFALAIVYTSLQFALIKNIRRYIYFFLSIALYILYLWWWDITPSVVSAFSLWPILIAIVFFYRAPRKEYFLFVTCLICAVFAIISYVGIDQLIKMAQDIYSALLYVTKNNTLNDIFPNTSISNSEQFGFSFSLLAGQTCSNIYFFVFAGLGLVYFAVQNPKKVLFFLPLLVVASLSYTSRRFIIFLAPLTALSISFFIDFFRSRSENKYLVTLLTALIISIHVLATMTSPPGRISLYSSQILASMKKINEITPKESIIYSWWDEGHPLVYWADRNTLADGMNHGGERAMYLAFPLTQDNFRQSANFISFFGTHGLPGIHNFYNRTGLTAAQGFSLLKRIFLNGPVAGRVLLKSEVNKKIDNMEEMLSFLFPVQKHPVYLFIDHRLLDLEVSKWIHWFGTWDMETSTGKKILYSLFFNNAHKLLSNHPQNTDKKDYVNLKNGEIQVHNFFEEKFTLKYIRIIDNKYGIKKFSFNTPNGPSKQSYSLTDFNKKQLANNHFHSRSGVYALDMFVQQDTAHLKDLNLANMLISKLFLYHNKGPADYFTLIDENPGNTQLWRVEGDSARMK